MFSDTRPFSSACENNKRPILAVLVELFQEIDRVLEIGSGSGQHAVYFSQQMPHLLWQPTERRENLAGIQSWRDYAGPANMLNPLELDVNSPIWDVEPVPAVFSANTAHIISWSSLENLFVGLGRYLLTDGLFCLYGPFNYQGSYTSESNAEFDQCLKERDPCSGIRHFEGVNELALQSNLILQQDNEMPANNRLLVWKKA